eukprot:CAMPEP_0175821506 /NCGR_PEP_ID=MMETSP0107_2-20121207/9176_1 /TAXON_ID=195067 ORGANISM="Goniomonas pacifica, Strain CCMP1869" /NCGR_SAMPLE_ID=MMETSP0107_2 /ASSEMBLY_ACC=CAM_ASM_000203 /LENGTH=118 /DNA_ID=CAMNT_0017133899 /DNA_START=300 /DNA_END=653 /DNA_ORIENTATION=+
MPLAAAALRELRSLITVLMYCLPTVSQGAVGLADLLNGSERLPFFGVELGNHIVAFVLDHMPGGGHEPLITSHFCANINRHLAQSTEGFVSSFREAIVLNVSNGADSAGRAGCRFNVR